MSRHVYDCPYNEGVECSRLPTPESCEGCGWRPEVAQRRIIKRDVRREVKKSLSGEIYFRDKQIQQLQKRNEALVKRNRKLQRMINKIIEEANDEAD